MGKVIVKANAKINLNLDIIGVDERNYHLMQMIMQSVDLPDIITVEKNNSKKIWLSCDNPSIPCNSKNICYKCAVAFFEHTLIKDEGVNIHIEKKIPQQAGMAGGSADGAGVLIALNKLFKKNLSQSTLMEIGSKIGADIPFCLIGATALVEGIGEKITPISNMPDCTIVIAKPKLGISTQRAFAQFDKLKIPPKNNTEALVEYIKTKDVVSLAKNMYNSLELVASISQISQIKTVMKSMGAKGSIMTGSGSAVFGIFTDKKRAFNCFKKLEDKFSDVFITKPTGFGVEILETQIKDN